MNNLKFNRRSSEERKKKRPRPKPRRRPKRPRPWPKNKPSNRPSRPILLSCPNWFPPPTPTWFQSYKTGFFEEEN
jgi:hypothetical protein